jgi:hypothetical protein
VGSCESSAPGCGTESGGSGVATGKGIRSKIWLL